MVQVLSSKVGRVPMLTSSSRSPRIIPSAAELVDRGFSAVFAMESGTGVVHEPGGRF